MLSLLKHHYILVYSIIYVHSQHNFDVTGITEEGFAELSAWSLRERSDEAIFFVIKKLQIATSAESRLAMTICSVIHTFKKTSPSLRVCHEITYIS